MPRTQSDKTPIILTKKEFRRGPVKTLVFSTIMVLLPVLFLFVIELSLRLAGYGDNYRLLVDFEHWGKAYKTTNSDYGKKYFSQINYTRPPNDIFLKEKPANGYRIFVMGSSTAAGFPYNSSTAFSRVLQQRLQDSYPEYYIEVVNIAITAINSFTLYDITEQILEQQPDAILIYAGHNEFYGAMGIASIEGFSNSRTLKLTHLKLMDLRLYQFMNRSLSAVSASLGGITGAKDQQGETLMESIARNKSIGYKSKEYNIAHAHFHRNMNSILGRAKKKGVEVFISQLVSNVGGLEPFVSVESDNHPLASDIFNMARMEYEAGNIPKARELFYLAKDLDGLRFRASEEINEIIGQLALHHHAHMVSMKDIFEAYSPGGIIGANLMTEHVHPFIDGYFLMADAFYNAITGSKAIASLDSAYYRPTAWYRENWGFTALDSIFVELRLRQMLSRWPFSGENHNPNSYLAAYKPQHRLDSLAMEILHQKISIREAYRSMARWHESRFNYQQAFIYTLAQARLNPHNPENFMKAGDLLLMANNPQLALEMYLLSMRHTRQADQLYKTGELYLRMGEKQKADQFLSEALTMAEGEVKTWIETLLAGIYREHGTATDDTTGETASAEALAQQRVVIFAPAEVTRKIADARKLMLGNNFSQALQLLHSANKIQETPAANRFIGEIMLHLENRESLIYLRKAYPSHNDNSSFITTLCYAAIVFSETDLAYEMLERLRSLDPDNQNIRILESKMAETTHGSK